MKNFIYYALRENGNNMNTVIRGKTNGCSFNISKMVNLEYPSYVEVDRILYINDCKDSG